MKAICKHFSGSDFDTQKGEIIEINDDIYISSLWRDGIGEISLSDPNREGYLLPQSDIHKMLQPGDKFEENYCHGQFEVLNAL